MNGSVTRDHLRSAGLVKVCVSVGIAGSMALAGCGSAARPPGNPGGSSTGVSSGAATPTAEPSRPPCADPTLAGRAVTYPNAAGATLTGYVLGTGRTGLVLAAQVGGTACSWLPYARTLAGRGYRVLAGNFSGEAGSTVKAGSRPSGDVAAGATYLRERGVTAVVLVGASRGGTAALVAAATLTPPVAGVLSLSGPAAYARESALTAVPTLTVPVLYVVAEGDSAFAGDARDLYAATPGTKRKLVVVPGSAHGYEFVLVEGAGSAEANAAIDGFLSTYAQPAA
jgi:dienelactone hydrolase